MGLRDALKSLRGGEAAKEEDISDADAPEPTWFQPRSDGSYAADLASAVGGQVGLRFLAGHRVFETTGGPGASGPEEPNPCRGEYTAAGRFSVQRRFERIVTYAVLEMTTDGFRARRIDAADRSTAELDFGFLPDAADPASGS